MDKPVIMKNESGGELFQKLHQIYQNSPLIHRPETERPSDAFASRMCYGIAEDLIQYIIATVDDSMTTAETGCGISTIAFSATGARHLVITPDAGEESAVRQEAENAGISLANTKFIIGPSEDALPKLEFTSLSLALIDGKHAYPWPFIDWFYFARAMKKDSIMIIDDASMPSVKMLCDVLDHSSSEWRKIESLADGRTLVYQCLKENVLDVIWSEQYINRRSVKRSFCRRVFSFPLRYSVIRRGYNFLRVTLTKDRHLHR